MLQRRPESTKGQSGFWPEIRGGGSAESTWQAGGFSAEQVGQPHRPQLVLQTEAFLHPEARDERGDGCFLHLVKPAVQFLQVQTRFHLNTQEHRVEQQSNQLTQP